MDKKFEFEMVKNAPNEEVNKQFTIYLEEEETSLEVAASFATVSTLGTATGCASSLGTVSCWG